MNGMQPILFSPQEKEFKTQGLGVLAHAISCEVTEERNGIFELEMKYPMNGIHFKEIKDRCILYTIPSPYRLPQPFRIYRITKPLNGICNIYAQHISYDLSGFPLNTFTASSAPQAMAGLKSNTAIPSDFRFWTDKQTAANFKVSVPSSTRSVLGGQEGSILDIYGGEYEWDKFTVKLHSHRGQDNSVTIQYGKNLTDAEQDRNISNVYTGIYPYWTNTEGELVTCEPKTIKVPGRYDFERILPVDFSQDFEEKPSPEQLQQKAQQYIQANKIGTPKVSITAKFVHLEQTEEYKHLALLEKCDLCDIVTIEFECLGIDAKAKIIKIKTDCLKGRYIEVEIGDARTNIADTIVGQGQEIHKKPNVSEVQKIANTITNTILGAKGGTVRFIDTNNDGEPDTLYIADNADPAKAKKVWRFNYEGWGASKNGYNGPFSVAATLEDGFYADFITAGVINAVLIKAGILQSKDGKSFWNLDTGQMNLNGNFCAEDGHFKTQLINGLLQMLYKNALQVEIGALDKHGRGTVRTYKGKNKETFSEQSSDNFGVMIDGKVKAIIGADDSQKSGLLGLWSGNGNKFIQIQSGDDFSSIGFGESFVVQPVLSKSNNGTLLNVDNAHFSKMNGIPLQYINFNDFATDYTFVCFKNSDLNQANLMKEVKNIENS